MIKIVSIVGARPQFVKAAVLSRHIRSDEWRDKYTEILVHTGQHYDQNMSDIFFKDMEIPLPDYNLNIGSGTHGKMTGEMLIKIEEVLIIENPDLVIVYGDTNSTLAGALAASKLHIPIAHVEAGLRSYWKYMPEEQNRILTDHLSDYLFCPTINAVNNLKNEGLINGVYNVGDIMLDANLYYLNKLRIEKNNGINRLDNLNELPKSIVQSDFILATVHRAENTDNPDKLKSIIQALNGINSNVIIPLHPRTRNKIKEYGIKFNENVIVIDPVGYFEMIELESKCTHIITDSGGIQKEAYFMRKPCITLREQTEWIETVESGWNTLAGSDIDKIEYSLMNINIPQIFVPFYGRGDTGQMILDIIADNIN